MAYIVDANGLMHTRYATNLAETSSKRGLHAHMRLPRVQKMLPVYVCICCLIMQI